MVPTFRSPEAQCTILPDRQHGLGVWRYSSLWHHANERHLRPLRLEVDLHRGDPFSVGGWFLIVDFPEDSPKSWNFLNKAEATLVVARIQQDRADTYPEKFTVGQYLKNALDTKVWAFAWLYMMTTTNSYAIAYFLPIILRDGMGFSVAEAQCLTAPPYVVAAIVMAIQSYYSDKYRVRGAVVAGNALIGTSSLF